MQQRSEQQRERKSLDGPPLELRQGQVKAVRAVRRRTGGRLDRIDPAVKSNAARIQKRGNPVGNFRGQIAEPLFVKRFHDDDVEVVLLVQIAGKHDTHSCVYRRVLASPIRYVLPDNWGSVHQDWFKLSDAAP